MSSSPQPSQISRARSVFAEGSGPPHSQHKPRTLSWASRGVRLGKTETGRRERSLRGGVKDREVASAMILRIGAVLVVVAALVAGSTCNAAAFQNARELAKACRVLENGLGRKGQ